MNTGCCLNISAKNLENEIIAVNVEDNGCGIPAEDVDRVFEPFFSTKTHKGGTGLGLSITYNLVHEIGGTIEVQSKEGEGTTFRVIIPIKIHKKEKSDENITG
jgi:signal transduction histidine kinase